MNSVSLIFVTVEVAVTFETIMMIKYWAALIMVPILVFAYTILLFSYTTMDYQILTLELDIPNCIPNFVIIEIPILELDIPILLFTCPYQIT